MKHVDLFNDFLKDVVNLNSTRVAQLETSIQAIKDVLEASDWVPEIDSWMPQGSWAHRTIIKPIDSGEFDADLLVFVHPMEEWSASKYIDELYNIFKTHGTYKDKVRRWSHCITITYANERKIDVAPCLINRDGYQRLEVCNRDCDSFELSEPRQYTEWLTEKNSYSGNNSFRKVTRLVKYLRDIKTTFTCSSVLLTTVLGYRIRFSDKFGSEFADTPTALKTIFGRMDDWLQVNPQKPSVTNPFLSSEDFASSWTDVQYTNFRNMVSKYRGWIDDAYSEQNRNESIAKWRRVFGDEFAADVVVEEAKSVSRSAVAVLKESISTAALFTGDLVAAVKQFGSRALPPGFSSLPHMQRPRWRQSPSPVFTVHVKAELYKSQGFGKLKSVQTLEPLPPNHWIYFTATTSTGVPLSTSEFRVEWRVTNTDLAAFNDRCLRGDFYPSDSGQSRWEHLKYRGVHLVEAFVIRKRDEVLVAKSNPFQVVIE
ncbi:nucleotidyltransferase [Microvirga sp. BT688]|uniref:SMODS domain-containing nucleotidyltransferase n=1 Tax=Microvirga sp. TaxID=1873136 RepID=UPI001689BB75|nr:nucleotidyltransferase [Microvirga sp.]MBD2746750.1 nucleotidyltransferase [Microvirga sp.]